MFIIPFMVPILLWLIFYMLNKLEDWDFKLSSSFECGFSTLFSSRYSFSIPYVFVAMIFLFLDLEFCMILPFFSMSSEEVYTLIIILWMMLFILVGLLIEWKLMKLTWMN